MIIESFGASDIGLVRLNNEDVWGELPNEHFYIIADGMGGHKAGEIAAEQTVSQICHLIQELYTPSTSSNQWEEIFKQVIHQANNIVLELATEHREMEGMGTTLCMAMIVDNKTLVYAHVGDSRIYHYRKGRLKQLTRDHSLRDDLIAKGKLDESKASSFPYKNIITRAIGTQKFVQPDVETMPIEPNDLFFLCTDGLTDCLPDREIQEIIDISPSPQEATEALILEAKKRGGEDNITILMVKIFP